MSENTRKTAIVTGASRGIGKAIAIKLAKSGYNIAIVDACPLEMSKEAEDEVKALGVDAKAYQCNVADFEKVGETVAQINEDFGGIYILVNNAGITRDGLLLKMTEENFDSVIAVNLKGTFNFIKHTTPIMMKKREGRVVSISSIVGLEARQARSTIPHPRQESSVSPSPAQESSHQEISHSMRSLPDMFRHP